MSDILDPPPVPTDAPSPEERQWGLFAHLSALAGVVIPIPFANILGPLIIWQMKKAEMPFVADQAKEALNFQITVAIAFVVCLILMFLIIGMLLLPVLGIAALVFTIIGAIKANNGEYYRYPFTLRLVK